MATPLVELLWWSGCPSRAEALQLLERSLAEVGLADVPVELRQIVTYEEAAREGFVGSPTIRVDGLDAVPVTRPEPALTCRVYTSRDGRMGPLPDPADVRAALARAVGC